MAQTPDDLSEEKRAPEEQSRTAPATPAARLDPAANDLPGPNARDGAKKRRDPNEPSAVVGLGASAGGVAVLQQFFEQMPKESGLAFVVVMHLSPDFESQLASVLQQKTSMPVIQVSEPVRVQPNHIYVIPPNHQLTFDDSMLRLAEPQQAQGRRVTIDLFFRTLAMAYGQRSVCVVLSGSDSDGVIGLKHIRAQGGVTIAQDPEEAEFNSMPLSAIETGMVDWILKVSEMPPRLVDLVKNENAMQLPPEIPEAGEPDAKASDAPGGETISDETRKQEDEDAIAEVLKHVRVQTGHDFTHYKRATILRRIARRMQVNSLESIPRYLDFLRTHPAEARALLHDLLIGVTHFFRDQASFIALESHIPQIFAGRKREEEIRIWVPGCATGEEAYSVAMLLCEHAEKLSSPPKIQIFATDIDEQAIHIARQGVYPLTIEADVSQGRLRAFFRREDNHYRVRKEARDTVLFATHNLLSDAPFSRLDLITCRNLLIYLNRTAQEQVFDVFHFALKPGGLLFIGGAETGDAANALFTPIDSKHRLYVRRSIPRPSWKIPTLPPRTTPPRLPVIETRPAMRVMTRGMVEDAAEHSQQSAFTGQERRAVLFGELHLKLLEEYGPPSIVVNDRYDIVHLSEHAGRYLKFRAGEPTTNLISVVHPNLRPELRTALFRASQSNERVTVPDVGVNLESGAELLTIQVRPVRPSDEAQGFFVVLFEKQHASPLPQPAAERSQSPEHVLADQVEQLKRQLDATVEQYEASSEELKASNEELQAMNEEMRSAAEELETSKEELQSVNEELTTVNHELKEKVEELSRVNSDLSNLMAATDIGTIFLDRQLRIQRFTPPAREIFNLQPSDIGRPISDITHKLRYERLIDDAHEVLDRLTPIEHEVAASNDRHLLARIAPYRTAEDKISGVVLTFVEITERRNAEEELRESEQFVRSTLDSFTSMIAIINPEGVILDVNRAWKEFARENHYAKTNHGIGQNYLEITRRAADAGTIDASKVWEGIHSVLDRKSESFEFEYPCHSPTAFRWFIVNVSPLETSAGGAVVWHTEITARKQAEEGLRESEERFRQFAENSADVFWIVDAKKQELEYLNPVVEEMFGEKREAFLKNMNRYYELIHPEDKEIAGTAMRKALQGERCVVEYRIIRPTDGSVRWIRDTGFPIPGENGEIARVAGVCQDVTEDRERATALKGAEERFRLLVETARGYAIFMVDPSNVITHWNTGAERIFGWSAEEAVGQSGEIIFTPEDRAREEEEKEIQVALEKGTANDVRWHLRKDGQRIWVDGVMIRLDDDETGALRGFAKIARDATAEREQREELERRVRQRTAELTAINRKLEAEIAQRSQLEQEILLVSEREKRRIGQDLHDSLCQELAATAFFLQSASEKLGKKNPLAAEALTDAAKTVNDNVGLARDLARGLHPVEVSASGLTNALRELAFRMHDGVACRFECPKPVRVRNDVIALNLYRIAQEAVTNAIKHGHASEVVITLLRDRKGLLLEVEDNGQGLPKRGNRKGMGLHIMSYRANLLGAHFEIEKRASGGVRVRCFLPARRLGR